MVNRPSIWDGDAKIGRDDDLSNSQFRKINEGITDEPSGEIQMSIKSTSASDTLAGTGAQKVRIDYLDANFVQFSEVVDLNGTTAVNTVATNIKYIEQFRTIQVGSNRSGVGTLNLKDVAETESYAVINIGKNGWFTSIHHVPAGKRSLITALSAGLLTSGQVTFRLVVESTDPSGGLTERRSREISVGSFDVGIRELISALIVMEKHRFWIEAFGSNVNQAAICTVGFIQEDLT